MSASPAVRRATAMLLLTTLLWGLSFPLVKMWQNAAAQERLGGELLASFTLIALRMLPAVVILIVLQPQLLRSTVREHAVGSLLGLVFFSGFFLQMWGLAWTSPALSAFITSLGCAWAPLLAWVCFGDRVARWTLLGLAVAVGGTAVLGLDSGTLWGLGAGEALTLLASLLFGVQILLLDRLGRTVRASHLSLSFFGVAGILALALAVAWAARGSGVGAWLSGTQTLLAEPAVLTTVVLLTLFPTVLSFYWMNTYQPQVSATRAAIIYLLEPVFAACFSIPLGLDELTMRLMLGGTLVLAGNLLAEWKTPTPHSPTA